MNYYTINNSGISRIAALLKYLGLENRDAAAYAMDAERCIEEGCSPCIEIRIPGQGTQLYRLNISAHFDCYEIIEDEAEEIDLYEVE